MARPPPLPSPHKASLRTDVAARVILLQCDSVGEDSTVTLAYFLISGRPAPSRVPGVAGDRINKKMRLDHARTLLTNPDITVADVADRVGVSPAALCHPHILNRP